MLQYAILWSDSSISPEVLDVLTSDEFIHTYSDEFIFTFFLILAEVFYNVNYVNVNYSVKNSTVDRKYLLYLQDFFFILKPKQYKKCQYS